MRTREDCVTAENPVLAQSKPPASSCLLDTEKYASLRGFVSCDSEKEEEPSPPAPAAANDVAAQPSERGASDAADAESAPEGGAPSEEAGAL